MSLHAGVVVKFESFKRFSDPVAHSECAKKYLKYFFSPSEHFKTVLADIFSCVCCHGASNGYTFGLLNALVHYIELF